MMTVTTAKTTTTTMIETRGLGKAFGGARMDKLTAAGRNGMGGDLSNVTVE